MLNTDNQCALAPATERMENVLRRTFRGMHHCPKIRKFNIGSEFEHWEINPFGGLSTFDSDVLTRLVIMAHDECVRVEIDSSGPGRVKIRLHARKRRTGGPFFERHNTLETAIARVRNGK